MKLMYWNVNGLRAVERKGLLRPLLEAVRPDVMGIQEIKAKSEQLTFMAKDYPDYVCHWHSAEKPGYSGTGLLIHRSFLQNINVHDDALDIRVGMEGSAIYDNDREGRVLCWRFSVSEQKVAILNIYFPNGGKSEQAWHDKLVFYDEFLGYINRLRDEGCWVFWGGDVNCAHEEIDLARPKDNEGMIGFRPEERSWISRCIQDGWVDIFRTRHPEEVVYSWWHMLTRSRERNIGWRIDYGFTQTETLSRIQSIAYLNEVQGSDHCPLLLDINLEELT